MPDAEIKIGCCGFPLPQAEYLRLFNLVEIQRTFYQLPRLETAERWRRGFPAGFEFTLKAWQLITHPPNSPTYRRLGKAADPDKFERCGSFCPSREVFDAWQRTSEFALRLEARLVIFQCPASFRPGVENINNMREFFRRIERHGLQLVWEPRGPWPDDLVRGLCQELGLIHCVDPFKGPPAYGDFLYFRLHGVGGYRYRYTDEDLARLKEFASGKSGYVLFNNIWMKDDALRFKRLMAPYAN